MSAPPDAEGRDDRWASALAVLQRGASELGVHLGVEKEGEIMRFCRLLSAANVRVNLTALRSPEDMMRGLILDSLVLSAALRRVDDRLPDAPTSLVDVGSGAGIPGIPLAILHRRWHVVLVDSIGKKAAFLETVKSELDPNRIDVLLGRAEELAHEPAWRDRADICTARAVGPLATVVELCAAFVRPGGWLAFPKGGQTSVEVASARAAARALRLELADVIPVPISLGLGEERTTVVYRKQRPTPRQYPRRTGMPRSRPLGN